MVGPVKQILDCCVSLVKKQEQDDPISQGEVVQAERLKEDTVHVLLLSGWVCIATSSVPK
jgi:hypothetical protein